MAWDENWMDEVTRKNAFRHEHQLSISGGTDKTQWISSLGYLNEDGTLKSTAFQRYNARVSVNSQITDWFASNANISLAHSITNYSDYEDTAYSNAWYTAQFANPLFPMYIKNLDGTDLLDADGNLITTYLVTLLMIKQTISAMWLVSVPAWSLVATATALVCSKD